MSKLLALILLLSITGCASRTKENNPLEKPPAPIFVNQSCMEKPMTYSDWEKQGDCYIKERK